MSINSGGVLRFHCNQYNLQSGSVMRGNNVFLTSKKINLQGVLEAKNALKIDAETLILDGGSIPKPSEYTLNIRDIKVISYHPNTQWLVDLIQAENDKKIIRASTDPSETFSSTSTEAIENSTSSQEPKDDLEKAFISFIKENEFKQAEFTINNRFNFPGDEPKGFKIIFNPKLQPLSYDSNLLEDVSESPMIVISNTSIPYHIENRLKQLSKKYLGEGVQPQFMDPSEYSTSCFIHPVVSLKTPSLQELYPHLKDLFSQEVFSYKLFHFKIGDQNHCLYLLHNPQSEKLCAKVNFVQWPFNTEKEYFFDQSLIFCVDPVVDNTQVYNELSEWVIGTYKESRLLKATSFLQNCTERIRQTFYSTFSNEANNSNILSGNGRQSRCSLRYAQYVDFQTTLLLRSIITGAKLTVNLS